MTKTQSQFEILKLGTARSVGVRRTVSKLKNRNPKFAIVLRTPTLRAGSRCRNPQFEITSHSPVHLNHTEAPVRRPGPFSILR
jgi:hypothetical protein